MGCLTLSASVRDKERQWPVHAMKWALYSGFGGRQCPALSTLPLRRLDEATYPVEIAAELKAFAAQVDRRLKSLPPTSAAKEPR